MNTQALQTYIDHVWDNSIIPALKDYIHIPNKSPIFDPDWQANGHMEKAARSHLPMMTAPLTSLNMHCL